MKRAGVKWARTRAAMAVIAVLGAFVSLSLLPMIGCRGERGDRRPIGRQQKHDAASSGEERPMTREKETPGTLADLAREVSLSFPASARLIGFTRENGMDDYLRFKVEIDAKDLDSFLASLPMPSEAFRTGARGFLGSDDGYWDPHRAPHLRTGQKILPDHRALNIGVSGGAGNIAALYIVNHGT